MLTNALRILREVNNYTQEFVAEDVLGISQTTYARLEQSPSKITAVHAQKLAELYKVSIANLLSEVTPVVTFPDVFIPEDNIKQNTSNSYFGTIHTLELGLKTMKEQNDLLIKQNVLLMELVNTLSVKLLRDNE